MTKTKTSTLTKGRLLNARKIPSSIASAIRHYASCSDFARQRAMTVSLILATLLHSFLRYVISHIVT